MNVINRSTEAQNVFAGSLDGSVAWPVGTLPEFWPMGEFTVSEAYENETDTIGSFVRRLDRAAELFDDGLWMEGMQTAHDTVWRAQRQLTRETWLNFSGTIASQHPAAAFVHQDPFTLRSFQKPRGYAGDAVLIDYIYGISHPEHQLNSATALGRWVYNYASNTMAPRAVRRRKELIAELIDRVCAQRKEARILSVACGHMREMNLSHAVQAGVIGEVIAFDQDAESLAQIERNAVTKKVRAVEGSVRRLIVGKHALGEFDLVYAAGLYDYLDQRAAKRLTDVLFQSLKPGGTLLIANFLTGIYDVGYMESFMGWNLTFRTPTEITALADGFANDASFVRYFEDTERNIGFLLARKKEPSS
jgi:SAM-dependent methyltransferase